MKNRQRAALQTYHAIRASDLATAFNEALKRTRLNPGDYGVELTSPEGPSTAGGVQALQHVRLVPSDASAPTLLIGHANHADGKAELRTFAHVDASHRERFRRALPLDPAQYEQALVLAKQTLEILRLRTVIVDHTPVAPVPSAAPISTARRSEKAVLASLVVILVVICGIGLWAYLHAARST